MAITPNPLNTPGFFQQAAMPVFGGLVPGTLPQSTPTLPKITKADQEAYVKNVMAELMASMQSVQMSFAMYLGAPVGGAAGLPAGSGTEQKK